MTHTISLESKPLEIEMDFERKAISEKELAMEKMMMFLLVLMSGTLLEAGEFTRHESMICSACRQLLLSRNKLFL